jgi:hypothetical protein
MKMLAQYELLPTWNIIFAALCELLGFNYFYGLKTLQRIEIGR